MRLFHLFLTISVSVMISGSAAAGNNATSAASQNNGITTLPINSELISLKSLDGRIEVRVFLDDALSYSVFFSGEPVLEKSKIGMELSDGTKSGDFPKLVSKKIKVVNEVIESPFYRFSKFTDSYQELDLKFKNGFGVIFRAYNEGVSYRFYSMIDHVIEITGESAEFNFGGDYVSYLAYSKSKKDPFAMSFQNYYSVKPLSQADSTLAFLPATIDLGKGRKLTITESDLEDYPGMFLKSQGEAKCLKGVFAPLPSEVECTPKRLQEVVKSREPIIARVNGNRSFPWRILAITDKDTQMPVNNLVYALASPNRIGDWSWVKPGKVAWDWWNNWGLYNVDFKAGINMETYKYFIDFASRYGIEYIVLDEGWYDPAKGNLMAVIPELNLPELIAYGKCKNVNIVLWAVINVLDNQLKEACKYYSELGIKGFKIDFLNRDDQKAVEMVYRVAKVAAQYKLMLDYHGFYKPTGLNRTFPNIVNFEGVFGLEELKWTADKVMPEYDVTLPFIRMMAGPVDYTPGAMRNATKDDFQPVYSNPMSQGTRCHQLATYIVFDSPLTMLCDSPTLYEQNPECTQFISSLPVVADETLILDGELGEYIVTARRSARCYVNKEQNYSTNPNSEYCEKTCKNNCSECSKSDCSKNKCSSQATKPACPIWVVGGLTNWTARDLEISLSFLEEGKTYRATLYKDGPNSERQGADYSIERLSITKDTKLKVHLASGGGFALSIN